MAVQGSPRVREVPPRDLRDRQIQASANGQGDPILEGPASRGDQSFPAVPGATPDGRSFWQTDGLYCCHDSSSSFVALLSR